MKEGKGKPEIILVDSFKAPDQMKRLKEIANKVILVIGKCMKTSTE